MLFRSFAIIVTFSRKKTKRARSHQFSMASSESTEASTASSTSVSNAQSVVAPVTQQQQEKSAGVPLSDFVLQLEDYASTVIIVDHSRSLRRNLKFFNNF